MFLIFESTQASHCTHWVTFSTKAILELDTLLKVVDSVMSHRPKASSGYTFGNYTCLTAKSPTSMSACIHIGSTSSCANVFYSYTYVSMDWVAVSTCFWTQSLNCTVASVLLSSLPPQAMQYDYDVQLKEPETGWKFDVEQLSR